MQQHAAPLPTVLPVTPVAYILGGESGVTTRMGGFYFPHGVAQVPPIYFASPPPPLPQREAKCKANEKLSSMNVDEQDEPDAPVVEKIKITKTAPANKCCGRKPKNNPKPPRPVVALLPPPPKPVDKMYVELPGGGVRVRDTKLDPHQFRTMVDINGREWLVFIRFSLQVAPEKYAYELFFVGKYRENLRARYVGKLDELLSDGRALFRQVESLHGLNLNKYAWWALNKVKIPIITKQPGHCEARCLPFHMRKNEDGLETHEPGVFEPNDFVTYVADGKHIQAYVLARHEPVCAPAERLYVLLCLGEREYVVHTVLPKDIRPPEIQSVVRPKSGDCWWVRDHTECMMNPFLEQHLSFCPPPRDAFKRGHVVSVPDPCGFNQRIPACVTRAWVIDGRMAYKVQYPASEDFLYHDRQTIFQTQDLLGPSVEWNVADYSFDLLSSPAESPRPLFEDSGDEGGGLRLSPPPTPVGSKRLMPVSPPRLDLGPASAAENNKVRRIELGGAVMLSSVPSEEEERSSLRFDVDQFFRL